MNFVDEQQTYRFQMLYELYKRTNADIDYQVDLNDIANHVGINNRNFQSVYKYLFMQDFINMKPNYSNGNEPSYYASITHKGIKSVEDVFRMPQQPTEHFPAFRDIMG